MDTTTLLWLSRHHGEIEASSPALLYVRLAVSSSEFVKTSVRATVKGFGVREERERQHAVAAAAADCVVVGRGL